MRSPFVETPSIAVPSSSMVALTHGCSAIFFGLSVRVPVLRFLFTVKMWPQNCWGVGGGFSIRVSRWAVLIWPAGGRNFSRVDIFWIVFRTSLAGKSFRTAHQPRIMCCRSTSNRSRLYMP